MPIFRLTGDILHASVVEVEADDIEAAITKAEDDNDFTVLDEQGKTLGFTFADHAEDEDGNDLDHLFLANKDEEATITRPNGRQVDEIVEAALNLDTVWGVSVASEAAGHFTCSEVEALARLFRSVGLEGLAQQFIDGHAEDDEEGDEHWMET